MLAIFAVLTATCLFNLVYILRTLQTTVFLDSRDTIAMIASLLNLGVLAAVVGYGRAQLDGLGGGDG